MWSGLPSERCEHARCSVFKSTFDAGECCKNSAIRLFLLWQAFNLSIKGEEEEEMHSGSVLAKSAPIQIPSSQRPVSAISLACFLLFSHFRPHSPRSPASLVLLKIDSKTAMTLVYVSFQFRFISLITSHFVSKVF